MGVPKISEGKKKARAATCDLSPGGVNRRHGTVEARNFDGRRARNALFDPRRSGARNEDDRPNKLQHGMDKHFCKRDLRIHILVHCYSTLSPRAFIRLRFKRLEHAEHFFSLAKSPITVKSPDKNMIPII